MLGIPPALEKFTTTLNFLFFKGPVKPRFLLKVTGIMLLMGLYITAGYTEDVWAEETSKSSPRTAIVFYVGATSLSELVTTTHMPTLRSLMDQGALGIMNVRTAGYYSPEHAYATIGAKDRAFGSARAGHAFEDSKIIANSTAGQVFSRRTGVIPPPGSVVVLDYPYLLRVNHRYGQDSGLGTLGEYLKGHGKQVAIIGNADTEEPGREIALALMGKDGYVPTGRVGNELIKNNPKKIYGIETAYDEVLKALLDYLPSIDCIFVETGDTSRLEKGRDLIVPAQKRRLKEVALQDFDGFLKQLLRNIDLKEVLLLFVSPYPSRESIAQGDTLTPILAVSGDFKPGLLYSPSTRRPGILTLFDLQSTLLTYLGLNNPSDFQGRPLTSVSHPEPVAYLLEINNRIIKVNKDRSPILKGFVVVQIILIFLSLAVILFRPKPLKIYQGLNVLLTGITSVPLALLILPLLNTEGTLQITLYLLFISIAVGMLLLSAHAQNLSSPRLPGLVALITALLVLLDTINHSALMRESILGFSPVGGARYYGIGNEYLGILLGASITGTTVLMDWIGYKRWVYYLVLVFYIAWTYFAAAPWFGSNFGGGIALSVTYLVIFLLLSGIKWSRSRILLTALAGAVIFVTTLGIIDLFNTDGAQSHLGRLISTIRDYGPGVMLPIILRKIRMNLILLEYTIWTKALLSFIIVLGVLFYRPSGKLAEIAERYPVFFKGFWSVVVGSIVVLFVNDSGIVAASTSLLYPVMTMLTIVLKDLSSSHLRSS